MQPNTESYIYLKREIFFFGDILVIMYLKRGPRQLFFQCSRDTKRLDTLYVTHRLTT